MGGYPDGVSDCATATRPLACCNGVPRTQFAGFTTLVTPAAISGGRPGMHAACASEFAGSHMCHASEYLRAASPVPVPTGGAWIDPSVHASDAGLTYSGGASFGRHAFSGNCGSWGGFVTSSGSAVKVGGYPDGVSDCATAMRRIACCR